MPESSINVLQSYIDKNVIIYPKDTKDSIQGTIKKVYVDCFEFETDAHKTGLILFKMSFLLN